ncbi:hypothetical protein FM106_22740 [Brachybacterium faecium]|nr:hypothetical protein FM106_22740 [Brachybacterium faecium]
MFLSRTYTIFVSLKVDNHFMLVIVIGYDKINLLDKKR